MVGSSFIGSAGIRTCGLGDLVYCSLGGVMKQWINNWALVVVVGILATLFSVVVEYQSNPHAYDFVIRWIRR